jgi:type II secretory pathway component HofQ
MERRWRWRPAGAIVLAAVAVPAAAQSPAPQPPDLFVTRVQGAATRELSLPALPAQGAPTAKVELTPFPATELDERRPGAELDGPRRLSLSVSRPMPLRELLMLLVNGTPLSIVNDEGVDGTFLGELKDLSMRQALEAVLFPRGLDYDVQGTLVRVFPRRTSTRLFDVNYVNVRRTVQRSVQNGGTVDNRRPVNVALSSSSDSDRFEALGQGVQTLLSSSGRMYVDRDAGVLQVTDFSDRLDLVAVYVEAVQMRALRQVRIEAQILDVALGDSPAIDWAAVRSRIGGVPQGEGRGAAGIVVSSIDVLKRAVGEQGVVTLIASPQIVALNNQPAIIRAGTEHVVMTAADHDGADERAGDRTAALEGFALMVTAQVSADGLVLLNVAPSYSTRTGTVKSGNDDVVPVLHINEADTTVRVQDGETIVLSGFLDSRPAVKPATGFAAMFGVQPRTMVKSELVILLTPTIVSPGTRAADGIR